MNKKLKSIPKFRSEAAERRFWETHDSSDYIDWARASRVRFPNLKPSTIAISFRLPVTLLALRLPLTSGMFLSVTDEDLACRKDGNTMTIECDRQ